MLPGAYPATKDPAPAPSGHPNNCLEGVIAIPVKDWQIDLARTILEIPPDDWGTDTEDAFARLLSEIGGESGAAAVVPHYAGIRGINPPPFTPARTYWVSSPAERLSKLPGPTWYWTENIDVPERI